MCLPGQGSLHACRLAFLDPARYRCFLKPDEPEQVREDGQCTQLLTAHKFSSKKSVLSSNIYSNGLFKGQQMEGTSSKLYFKITKAWKRNNVIDLPHMEKKNPHLHIWIEGSLSALIKDLLSKLENKQTKKTRLFFFPFWNCRYVLFNGANVCWQFAVNCIAAK